jgi:hypothetical protein
MSAAEAGKLGAELRHGSGDFLEQRRTAASLALAGIASLGVVTLYQLGILDHLPEPSWPRLNAEKVNGSAQAYHLLDTPDAVLGLGSYAMTLGLAAMGGADRSKSRPWIPLALCAKAAMDVCQAAMLTRKSWVKYRAFSLYSLITAAATLFALPAVIPEAVAAGRQLMGTSH